MLRYYHDHQENHQLYVDKHRFYKEENLQKLKKQLQQVHSFEFLFEFVLVPIELNKHFHHDVYLGHMELDNQKYNYDDIAELVLHLDTTFYKENFY
jgi:hypothetical protein